jgi:hypothetical protein
LELGQGHNLAREQFKWWAATKVRNSPAAESAPVLSPEQEAAINKVVEEATLDLKPRRPEGC